MNLVKWLRKNNRKLMAVVVILIMISFVLGSALSRLSRNMGGRSIEDAIWLFDEDGQISMAAQNYAEAELNALQALGMSEMLLQRNQQNGQITQRNLGMLLLHQLLFPQSSKNENLNRLAKMAVRQNQLPISEAQIDKFFIETSENPVINWILLKNEAKKNGITFLPAQAEAMLKQAEQRVAVIAKNTGLKKQGLYQAVADMIAVQMMLSAMSPGDTATITQIQNILSASQETFDAEIVKIPASLFVSDIKEPNAEEIATQFDAYKDVAPGLLTDNNPFGFGYKQPDRIKLEYALVNLADIEKLVPPVTEEDAEMFYQQNLKDLTRQVPSDPNDPNSPKIDQTIPYAKVAMLIKRQIKQTKINAKAEEVINSIKDTADAAFADIDRNTASFEDLQAVAESYEQIAKIAKEKFNVEIQTGTTSFVSAEELANASVLGNMAVADNKQSAVSLLGLIFSIDELSDRQLFDIAKPKMYQSIGILRDPYGKNIGIVRIVGAQKSYVPENVNTKIEISMPLREDAKIESFTISEKVAEDIKTERAFEIAAVKAEEFVSSIKDANWTGAIDEFNSQNSIDDPNAEKISLDTINNQRRMTLGDVEMAKIYSEANPNSASMLSQATSYMQFIKNVYNTQPDQMPATLESKPEKSIYIIKSVNINRMNVDEYNQAKNIAEMKLDEKAMQIAAAAFLMPENIKSRMNFRLAKEPEKKADANQTDEK